MYKQQKDQLISLSNKFFGIDIITEEGNYCSDPKSFLILLHNETKIVKENCVVNDDTKIPSIKTMINFAKMRVGDMEMMSNRNMFCRGVMAAAAGMSLWSVINGWREDEDSKKTVDEIDDFIASEAYDTPYEEFFFSLTDGEGDSVESGAGERFVDGIDGGDGGNFELCVDTIPSIFTTKKRAREE